MIEVDFLEFIRTKSFGPIKIGDEKEYVIEMLGQPDGFSNPDIYDAILYGRFEFKFSQNKLYGISHGYILRWFSSWRFNRNFHYQNKNFKVKSWFSKPWIDTRLKSVKEKLEKEGITYKESLFYDCVRFEIGEYLTLHFSSKLTYHKEPEEWSKIDPKILNLRLSHFYLWDESYYLG